MDNNKFLIDLPEKQENDAIGYEVYVNDIIDSIRSDARMIGLISNYGSGKSTVINMVREKIKKEQTNDKTSKIISINLWKIKNEKNNDINIEENTLDIHKFLLRSLIQYLPNSANKDYFKRKVDNKYTLFNIILKNKFDSYALYLLLAIFFFNIIMKLNIVGFSVPRICNFILDLTCCIGFVFILSKSKIYLSFNKESSDRTINENDTIDCFNEIIYEINSLQQYNNIIICIEDLDRYNNYQTVIKVIEQIYKFYIENTEQIKVKFIISLKPPYTLVKDDSTYNEQDEDNIKEKIKQYKELYEKIFDIIINLQTVSYQNYGSILIKLLKQKEELLKKIDLEIPKNEEEIGIWDYLYKGKKVTVRDIKHRYNYFLMIYENLYNHKKSLENESLIQISTETCLFIAYLEDEYGKDFYMLLEDSKEFNNIVISYIFNKKIIMSETKYSKEFVTEMINALKKGIITIDYSMYFYKYPKGKPILNIFDSAIRDAIFLDNSQDLTNLELYCMKADKNIIIKSLKQKVKEVGIPEIIFENVILFNEADQLFHEKILLHLSQDYVFSSTNGLKKVREKLTQISYLNKSGEEKILENYINIISNDLEENFYANIDKIVKYRMDIIKTIGLVPELLPLYSDELPLITIGEVSSEMSPSIILYLINPNLIRDESILKIINIVSKQYIPFKNLILFFDKISLIDKIIFKKIFYSFDYTKYTKKDKYMVYKENYDNLELNDFNELKRLVKATEILPSTNEKNIINKLNKMSDEDKKVNERLYIDMINIVNNISSQCKKYISKCNC